MPSQLEILLHPGPGPAAYLYNSSTLGTEWHAGSLQLAGKVPLTTSPLLMVLTTLEGVTRTGEAGQLLVTPLSITTGTTNIQVDKAVVLTSSGSVRLGHFTGNT